MGQMQWMGTALKSPAMPRETTWQRQKKTRVNHENSIAQTTQQNTDHNAKEPFKHEGGNPNTAQKNYELENAKRHKGYSL